MMHTPPPFVQAIQYHELKQVNKNGKRVYETPSGNILLLTDGPGGKIFELSP